MANATFGRSIGGNHGSGAIKHQSVAISQHDGSAVVGHVGDSHHSQDAPDTPPMDGASGHVRPSQSDGSGKQTKTAVTRAHEHVRADGAKTPPPSGKNR
jgi:hypothetical protein